MNVFTKHLFLRPYEVLCAYERNLRKTLRHILSSYNKYLHTGELGFNSFEPVTIFAKKNAILEDIWQSSEYAPLLLIAKFNKYFKTQVLNFVQF